MNKQILVAPSLLAADFRFLDMEIKQLIDNGIKYLHFDVMDGHFVPNISFGLPVLTALSPHYDLVYDVHLMISNPQKYVEVFAKAGASIITFHYECFNNEKDIFALIEKIKSLGVKAGLSVKPNTPISVLLPFLKQLDLVLVMSVEPGFGGQKFNETAVNKIRDLKADIAKHGYNCLIEVDGGINSETGKLCKDAGADILVAGSYLFDKSDQKARIDGLRNA